MHRHRKVVPKRAQHGTSSDGSTGAGIRGRCAASTARSAASGAWCRGEHCGYGCFTGRSRPVGEIDRGGNAHEDAPAAAVASCQRACEAYSVSSSASSVAMRFAWRRHAAPRSTFATATHALQAGAFGARSTPLLAQRWRPPRSRSATARGHAARALRARRVGARRGDARRRQRVDQGRTKRRRCCARRSARMRCGWRSRRTRCCCRPTRSRRRLRGAAAVTMVATASSHYELIASAPRTVAPRRLKAAPRAPRRTPAADEPAVGGDEMAVGRMTAGRAARPTMAELERLQCSAAQLGGAQREARSVDGGWCVLDGVQMDVAMDIIASIEREWPRAVPVASSSTRCPPSTLAVRHCIRISTAAGAPWRRGWRRPTRRRRRRSRSTPPPCTAATRCTSSTT